LIEVIAQKVFTILRTVYIERSSTINLYAYSMKPLFLPLVAGLFALAISACATTPPPVPKVDYTKQVLPIFQAYCYQCHGDGKSRAGFHIDLKANVMKQIVPGDPDHSYLYKAITKSIGASDHMPPLDQDQPDEQDIATLKLWIEQGAVWPDGT
jgi:mono/diheme cytochrome c family protein